MENLPSAGIVITTEGEGDVDGVYIYNNIVSNVTGDGYRVYDHPGGNSDGGTVKNVHFINNTAFNTGTESGGGFRVNHETATGIVFRNNIAWLNNDYDVRGEDATLIENNLCSESFCLIQQDPQFVDADAGDFRLGPSSPAIDQGSSDGAPEVDVQGLSRPQGLGVDLGAHEYAPSDGIAPMPPSELIVN